MDGLLDGTTVLDLSTVGPATRCSRLLADYGARVVKVGAPPRAGASPIIPPFHAYSGQRGIKRFPVGMVAVRYHCRGNAMLAGNLQPVGIGAVADHRCNRACQFGLQQRLHIAATSGDQDDDFFHGNLN